MNHDRTTTLEVPDCQYEMLEDIAKAGWAAAFPEVASGEVVTRESIDAWLRFMQVAMAEMTNRDFKLARFITVPLDVERLWRAMESAGLGMPYYDADPIQRKDAERVVAEYARLATEGPA